MEGVLILWKVRRRLNAGAQGQGLGLDLCLHKGLHSEDRIPAHVPLSSIPGAQRQGLGLDLHKGHLGLDKGLHSEDQLPAHALLNFQDRQTTR